MELRKIIFWTHLLVGLVAGLVIGVMCFTGVTLAFKKQLIACAESDLRTIIPPTDVPKLPIETLLSHLAVVRPEVHPTTFTVNSERTATSVITIGRDAFIHANPYTGEFRQDHSQRMRKFLQLMEQTHRWLALSGEQRPVGKAITGASTFAFLFLAISGLWLWWPRRWTWRTIRPSLWFLRETKGRARDWNWHNTIGIWSLSVLIVLTSSGLVLSYRWVSNLSFMVVGETPPATLRPDPVVLPPHEPGLSPVSLDILFEKTVQVVPDWKSIAISISNDTTQTTGVTVRELKAWPYFSTIQLSLDPFTGDVLGRNDYESGSTGRKIRAWLRFLHTGEAFGWPGQLAAAIAATGGLLLVWTGISLGTRRFYTYRKKTALK